MTFYERWALGIGGFLIVSSAAITTAREADTEPFAEALGSGFGIALVGLVFALIGRFVYVRIRGGGRRTISPWLVLVAGTISLLAFVTWAVDEEREEERRTQIGE